MANECPKRQTGNPDVAPDGERFLMLEGSKPRIITVVLNWLDEPKSKIQE